jgi:3-methylcrotonyl-CoA carboxylase alpha subunit
VFQTLLIANRGEIACRIAETARRLGVRAVAVYSEADADARHVRQADEAWCIGPPPAASSYLCQERILEVARASGAAAVHPGYGFLSENAEFAEACEAAGLVFVGPPPGAIRVMGRKDAAKALMERAGVPVVPGHADDEGSLDSFAKAARRIGYPVLVKAVAGGGGRGMRRVDAEGDLEAALAGARREARAAFGDDRVLIEKFLPRARHIEVQVFADDQGNAVHLFERDCSLQRRHQKVVEEAPAPGIDASLRAGLGEAALLATRAIGYRGAGTVEFIVDASRGMDDAPFYFMEMNTRLQVEHPVTEFVTGQDLVAWQLRVAAGEPLPLCQEEIALRGHAIEVRLYAEDPARKYLPSTGTLGHLRLPAPCRNVRVDAGVEQGDRVPVHYDALLAKLIVWDEDRAAARARLRRALAQVEVVGVATNTALLAAVAAHPAWESEEIDTDFLARHAEVLLRGPGPLDARSLAAACLHVLLEREADAAAAARVSEDRFSPWSAADGFRLVGVSHDELRFVDPADASRDLCVTVRRADEDWELGVGGAVHRLRGSRGADGRLQLDLDGARFAASTLSRERELFVWVGGVMRRLARHDPQLLSEEDESAAGAVHSPMPGRVLRLRVAVGDRVRRGQPLLVVEAMKMEHELRAPADGVVAELGCREGDQVEEGVALLRVSADA